jgi:uncharacterized protein YndB with AHSA1/START domain
MEAQLVKTETALEVQRVFSAPVALVYKAWTDPDMMNRWFHPGPEMRSECEVDLRIGGRYEVRMYPSAGGPHIVRGAYREIVPEEKLVFTWRWQAEDAAPEMLVTVTFRRVGDEETEVSLLHEQFVSDEERDSHASGWEGTFAQLAAALA